MVGGGMAGNLAHAVARLGGKVAMVSAIGDDRWGDAIIEELQSAGVNTDYVYRRQNTASPITIILVLPSLDRAGLVFDIIPEIEIQANEVPDDVLVSTKVFFTDMKPANPIIQVARRVKQLGIPIAFTMHMAAQHENLPGHHKNILELLTITEIFFSEEENILYFTGQENLEDAIVEMLKRYPGIMLVTTRGLRGSLIATSQAFIPFPVLRVPVVVDNIGAGDAYHGAFLYTHNILGWSLESAGVFASATAAPSCTQAGARAGLPNMQTVLEFIRDFGIQLLEVN
jgi:sulfofructose kinase